MSTVYRQCVSCRAGHATTLLRQRDQIFRLLKLLIGLYSLCTYIPVRQRDLKIVVLFLVTEALFLCRVVVVANIKNCRVPISGILNISLWKYFLILLDGEGKKDAWEDLIKITEDCKKGRVQIPNTSAEIDRARNSLIGFLSESLDFCEKMSELAIRSKKRAIR